MPKQALREGQGIATTQSQVVSSTEGWVGLEVGLDGKGKARPPQVSDPRTCQPLASHYTY